MGKERPRGGQQRAALTIRASPPSFLTVEQPAESREGGSRERGSREGGEVGRRSPLSSQSGTTRRPRRSCGDESNRTQRKGEGGERRKVITGWGGGVRACALRAAPPHRPARGRSGDKGAAPPPPPFLLPSPPGYNAPSPAPPLPVPLRPMAAGVAPCPVGSRRRVGVRPVWREGAVAVARQAGGCR